MLVLVVVFLLHWCESSACWEAVICEYESVHFVPCVSVDCEFAEKKHSDIVATIAGDV